MRDWPPCPPIQRDGGRRSRPGASPFIAALTAARRPATFPGSAATASGRFVQKPARRARDGAFTYPPLSETGPMFCSFPFAKRRPVFRPEQTGRKKRRAPSASPAGILHCPLQSRVPKRGGALPSLEPPTRKGGMLPPPRGTYRLFFGFGAPAVRLRKSRRGIGVVFLSKKASLVPKGRPPPRSRRQKQHGNVRFQILPCRAKGAAPALPGGQRGNPHPHPPQSSGIPTRTRRAKRRRPPPQNRRRKEQGSVRFRTPPCRAKGAAPALPGGRRGNPHPLPPQSSGIPTRTRRAKRRRPPRSGRQAKESTQFKILPCRPNGTAPCAAGQRGNPHPHRRSPACFSRPRRAPLFQNPVTQEQNNRKRQHKTSGVKRPARIRGHPPPLENEDGGPSRRHGERHEHKPRKIQPVDGERRFFRREQPGDVIARSPHRLDRHGAPNRFHRLLLIPPAESAEQPNGDQRRRRNVQHPAGKRPALPPFVLFRLHAFQKVVRRHPEKVAQSDDLLRLWHALPALPLGDRLPRNVQPLCKRLLRKPLGLPQILQPVRHVHGFFSSLVFRRRAASAKRRPLASCFAYARIPLRSQVVARTKFAVRLRLRFAKCSHYTPKSGCAATMRT